MSLRSATLVVLLVGGWALSGNVGLGQEKSKWQPAMPPEVSFAQVQVAKLRSSEETDEPTITFLGYEAKTEVKTRKGFDTRVRVEQRTRAVVRNGEKVQETYNVQVPVRVAVEHQYSVVVGHGVRTSHVAAAEIQAWDVAGKLLTSAELIARCKKPRHVFILAQPWNKEAPLDEFHRSVLNDDVLFVHSPKLNSGKQVPVPADAARLDRAELERAELRRAQLDRAKLDRAPKAPVADERP